MGLESYFTSGQKSEVVDGGMRNGDAAKSEKVNTPESLRNVRCLRGPDSGRGARGYKLPHEMERVFKAFPLGTTTLIFLSSLEYLLFQPLEILF